MANRAYLRCLQGRSDHEVSASYSLPDAWCDLFGPSDFHTGNDCPVPDACKPTTTSYLLAEAPAALARFAERMNRAKIRLEGDGLTARVYAWLTTHFAEGWLFADTTELEWMRDDFVPLTRKQLKSAEKRVRRGELTAKTLLVDFGWGTGLSATEVEEEHRRARQNPHDVATLEGRPYRIEDTYTVGEVVAHRVFGSGTVRTVKESTVTIAFAIGTKTLAHRKG
ncbi:hypothetical protein KEG38_52065 [Polyangium jinanense]|uniref:hypothetical protein n=1 Tax=Polyangium jinanense TaxID=2829994 RepID=UPI002340E5A1|nr:hypothetical protein [Polyangium jinanense]MDC3962461.1 hypothetical protein [Polyangium jinanense]